MFLKTIWTRTLFFIDYEWEHRKDRKISWLIKQANFKQPASLTDVNYAQSCNLDKNMFARFGTLNFIKRKENIVLTGASGVGKSYLGQALGHQACLMGYNKTIYTNTTRLFKRLKLSRMDGTYLKDLKNF